jgi:Kef-type K+ transport system membrane component KefB
VVDFLVPYHKIEELATLVIGIMLITSYLFADIIRKIRFPRLTGYMLMGVILGSSGVGILTTEIMDNLQFLENLALSFIALTAGGELRFEKVRMYLKSINYILFSQIIIIFVGMAITFYYLAGFMPIIKELDVNMLIGFAILFGGVSLSTSPATTIGIITELSSEGKVTNIILIITVLKAIFLILIFPIIITISTTLMYSSSPVDISFVKEIAIRLLASVGTGIIIGAIIIWYLKKVRFEMSIFLLGATLAITEVSSLIGLEVLLTSLVAGIVVQNFSRHGQSLISGIEIFSLPIYVIFFCFAGAKLHLNILSEALIITLVLVIARLFLNFVGNYTGAVIAKEEAIVKNISWMGYIGQAGIALGLGIIIKQNLPGEIGSYFYTLLLSTVIINEMIGPVLLRYVFVKSGEAQLQE